VVVVRIVLVEAVVRSGLAEAAPAAVEAGYVEGKLKYCRREVAPPATPFRGTIY